MGNEPNSGFPEIYVFVAWDRKKTENAALESSKEWIHNPAATMQGSWLSTVGCVTSNQGYAEKQIANKTLSLSCLLHAVYLYVGPLFPASL